MKILYTYPAGFRPTPHDEQCLYTVNPGIPLPTAVDELAGILGAILSILTDVPTKGMHIDTIHSLVDCAINHVYYMQTSGVITSDQLDAVGETLVDSSNTIAPCWQESTLYGIAILLNVSIGLTRSLAESCKGAVAA